MPQKWFLVSCCAAVDIPVSGDPILKMTSQQYGGFILSFVPV